MNKIKVSEATNLQLDWLVAKCEGAKGLRMHTYAGIDPGPPVLVVDWEHGWTALVDTNYTTDWSQGGPIIERERIKVAPNLNQTWHGQIRHTQSHPLVAHPVLAGWTNKHGPTPLIAAMRCYVTSKLGETVAVPEELT